MLRRSLLAFRAQRCLYETLGVSPSANSEEIKRAFRDRAKQTHPDAAKGAPSAEASRGFGDLVEAYRVLRDPSKRKKYDQETTRAKAAPQYGPSWAPRDGPGAGGSRETMYSYAAQTQPGAAAGIGSRISSGEQTAIAVILLGALAWLASRSNPAEFVDPDPHPKKRPQAPVTVNAIGGGAGAGARQSPAVVFPTPPSPVTSAGAEASAAAPAVVMPAAISRVSSSPAEPATIFVQEREQPPDDVVRAFYNPYADKWMRIPEGYEAPAAMDLTAWHKKRTEPSEWARLFAEGKLSEIMPRGGLKVRYLPAWETFDAMIVWDPLTGKTVSVTDKLPKRVAGQHRQECDVRF